MPVDLFNNAQNCFDLAEVTFLQINKDIVFWISNFVISIQFSSIIRQSIDEKLYKLTYQTFFHLSYVRSVIFLSFFIFIYM